MLNKILSLTKEFIAIESTADNKNQLTKILELALTHLDEFTIEKFEKNGTKSALIYNTKKKPKKFHVIFTGHLDVIPGDKNKFTPKIIGDRLYGIGSMDMKANIACMIFAFKNAAKKITYPLALQLVTDEQSGSINGTKYQIEKGVKTDFVIAGESTNFEIVHKAKGVLWLKISTKGKSAHSAYPWQGKNAIWQMHTFLTLLKKTFPQPKKPKWQTTINVSNIETTNVVFNKIPDICTIWLDIRYIPEEKNVVLEKIKEIIPPNFTINVIFEDPPLSINKNDIFLKKLQKSASKILNKKVTFQNAHGTSDVTYYTRNGSIGVEFGAIGEKGNTYNEYVSIISLDKYYYILTNFLLDLD